MIMCMFEETSTVMDFHMAFAKVLLLWLHGIVMHSYIWPFILPLSSSGIPPPQYNQRTVFLFKFKYEIIQKEDSVHVFKNTGIP